MNPVEEPANKREGEKMSAAKVKDTSGSTEVRHQLQKMVSGKLANRGISTNELWSPKGKAGAKLTKEEEERLERQRYNKRKWAQKDRARSKELLEKLRQDNDTLEFRKQRLTSEVDKLKQLNHQMREALTDHPCRLNVQKTFLYMPLADDSTDATTSKDASVEAESYGSFKHPFLSTIPKQAGHAERKRDTRKEISSGNFVPVTQGGYIVVDKLTNRQNSASSQRAQHSKMYRLLPFPPEAYLTEVVEGSTRVHQLILRPERFSRNARDAGGVTSVTESQPADKEEGGISGQSLTSGGFTVSDSGKSFLQMLQDDDDDDDDVEMKEDFRAVSETGGDGQYIGVGARRSSVSGLAQHVTAMNRSETGGREESVVIGPPSISQDYMLLEPAMERRPQSSDFAQDQVVPVTAGSGKNVLSHRQPDNAENDPRMNRSEAKDVRQTAENPSVPVSPLKSHTPFSKPAKHRTRKGVLMERWFAQEHRKELKRKKTKMRAVSVTSPKRNSLNPWAVVFPSETKEAPVPSQVVDSEGVVLGTVMTSVTSDPNCKTGNRAISCSFPDTQHAPEHSAAVPGTAAPLLQGPPSGSKAAVSSEGITTDTGNIENAAKSFLEMFSIPSDMCEQNAEDDDSSMPSLAEEGRGLTRRQSWPGEDPDSGKGLECRPRSSSLPSSFSDVVFEVADSEAQSFFTPEQFLSLMLNTEGADTDDVRMVVVDPSPHTVSLAGFSVTVPIIGGADLTAAASAAAAAATSTQPNFLMDKMPSTPSTPSSPPSVCPFDTRPGAPGSSREGAGGVQKGAVSGGSSQHEQRRWERERPGAGDSRVTVERVPDADINTWQAVSLPAEHMDTSQWQSFTCL